jgi:hypothetical protein
MPVRWIVKTGPSGGARAATGIFGCALLAVVFSGFPRVASAVPSFARQTGLPCAQCHVIAFGPALTEYGRQFKLNGYTFAKQDGGLKIPLAATLLAGYSIPSKAAPNLPPYSDDGNLVVQDVSAFLAGRLGEHLGAFVKGTYDGVARSASWDNLDVRYARTLELGTHALVAGIDVNNNPTVQDLWNSTPIWSFPYVLPRLVPGLGGATMIQGALGQSVLGASAYSMIDNRLYLELGFYREISDKWLGNLGEGGFSTHVSGAAPYARVTLQRQDGPHYFAVGAVGLSVKQRPFTTTSQSNRFDDYGLDGTYQFSAGGEHAVDAHLAWYHEDRSLDASFATHTSDAVSNSLHTLLADVSYALRQTWVGSLGLFDTTGSTNHVLFAPGPIGGSASGSPDSRGYTLQLEYVPFGKAGSFASPWINVRLGLQYTGYWRFNGGNANYDGFGRSASDNNTLFLFTWLAF